MTFRAKYDASDRWILANRREYNRKTLTGQKTRLVYV